MGETPLAGTERADAPFFSPDGDKVGFIVARSTLRVAPLRGGPRPHHSLGFL